MKIFGSISELVDLAFRLAGGKQVKLRSATQTTAGSTVTVNVPDVAATGDTQNMVLTAATQSLSNKTLSSPTISGGTINNSVIGGSTPAAGSFTDIVGSTLDINTSAELQTLTIPSLSTAGILHNNSSGAVSSSLIVNADVDAAAAIAFSKLASLPSAEILVGSGAGVATARTVTGDVTIDNLGVTAIGASKVTDGMLAGSITRTKLATGNNYRILANNSSGQMSENAALTANEAVATDANGQLVTVTGVSATELGYLSGVTSDIQTQISAKANSGANSDITSLSGLTTALSGAQGGTGVANAGKTITLGGSLVTSGNFTTTLTATNNTNVTLPTSGTLVSSTDTGTVTNTMLAGSIDLTTKVTGALPIANGGTGATSSGAARTNLGLDGMATQAPSGVNITGGTISGVSLQNDTLNGHKLGDGAASIASSTLTPVANKSLQLIATAGNFGMIASPVAGQQYVLVNESSSDITISNLSGATAANQIYTGTGADYTFKAKSAVSVVYDGTLSKWLLTGGGGAGGLSTSYVTAGSITAVANTHYLTNLSASGQTITLPAGVNGSVIRFSDAGEKWDVYPLTLAPATGEKIDALATNETLVCDVKRGWVELSYNSTFGGWALMSLASTSGSAAGSGEVNAILNPTAASGTTGWTGVTQVSSGSPLDPIVSSAFSISNVAGAESSTSGGYYSISSLAPSLKSKKLKVSFYFSTPATDVYKVSVYAGSTRLSLSSDSSGATSLPANVTGGYFEAYFDSTTASAYSLNITRTSGSTGACVITQVIVGPGSNAQGAAISEWQPYTPTVSTGTWTNTRGYYRRVGSSLELKIYAGPLTANGSGLYTWTLPSNLTADLTSLGASGITPSLVDTDGGSNTIVQVGTATINAQGSTWYMDGISPSFMNDARASLASTTTIGVIAGSGTSANRANAIGSENGLASVTGTIQIEARIPIAEWAGNGTVNLGGAAQVEYVSHNGTSSVYGPGGSTMPTTTSAAVTRTVTFQYPIQTDDLIFVEWSDSPTGQWLSDVTSEKGVAPLWVAYNSASEVGWGEIRQVSSTQVTVVWRRYRTGTSNWSASTDGYWRVRKAKAGAPVGFGLAGTDGSSGLYKPGLAPGYTGGAAIPTGYVGEMAGTQRNGTNGFSYSTRSTTAVTSSTQSLVSVPLNKGTYLIGGVLQTLQTDGAARRLNAQMYVGGTAVQNNVCIEIPNSALQTIHTGMIPVTISADATTVAIYGFINSLTGSSSTNNHELWVIRIA